MVKIEELISAAEERCAEAFRRLDALEEANLSRVLAAFSDFRVAQRHFAGSTGYGYDDEGRDALERIWARVFGCEAALVRTQLMSGTHAIAVALLGNLRPGQEMLAISGRPYDTLMGVIGEGGSEGDGSLRDMGVSYRELEDGGERISTEMVLRELRPSTKLVHIQRSRGYAWRRALSVAEIEEAAMAIHALRPDIIVFLDNCYGEFTAEREPVVDLMAGSLIKNPGGGLAPTGGYVAGRADLVERAAARLSAPGVGAEIGSYEQGYRLLYQGLFMAPHVVCQALRGSYLLGAVFDALGFAVSPLPEEIHGDIIQAVRLNDAETLIDFCRSVQAASPVDAYVAPEPSPMPGYEDDVIMAAGTFVGGASLELSADAPLRAPYTAYIQGGLSYAHVRVALRRILERMRETGKIAP